MRNILLLTATVRPLEGLPGLARVNPAQRLDDYRRALNFYLDQVGTVFDGIAFAENSNSDLSILHAEVVRRSLQRQVDFISFSGLDFPASYGRGYGEFRMVDHAVASSERLQDESAIIWKVTGRYIFTNIASIVSGYPARADLYCHMRNYPYRLCELFLLAWTQTGYREVIAGIAPSLRNDRNLGEAYFDEIQFRRLVEAAQSRGVAVRPRLAHVPVIDGVRGWNNTSFSPPSSPKLLVRKLANAVAPWIWI